MAIAKFLLDTSALARAGLPSVEKVLLPLLTRGELAQCGMTTLEALYSVRSPADHERLSAALHGGYEWLGTEDIDFRRALEVQADLARRGQLRSVSLPDLIVAAVAERHRVTVLHYDADYEYVADVTGQAVRWVVPRGSVD